MQHAIASRLTLPRAAWALISCMVTCGADAGAVVREEGVALDSARRVVYKETHWRYTEGDDNQRLVLYRCADGRPFARKHLRWREENAATPDFDFLDERDGYREGLASGSAGREVYWRETRTMAEKREPVLLGPHAVVDAGFDSVIRGRWDELLAGEVVRGAFLLAAEFQTVPIAIRRVPDGGRARNLSLTTFIVELDRWYGFAMPALTLKYGSVDRRLREFQGTVTIRDHHGKRQQLSVVFPDDASQAPATEVAAATAEPLTPRCQEY